MAELALLLAVVSLSLQGVASWNLHRTRVTFESEVWKRYKAQTRDATRALNEVERVSEEMRQLHGLVRDILSDPRIDRLLNERHLPTIVPDDQ